LAGRILIHAPDRFVNSGLVQEEYPATKGRDALLKPRTIPALRGSATAADEHFGLV
jgi:hypothetical protein